MTIVDFFTMYRGYVEHTEQQHDTEMIRTAWFTSLIMNAVGRYKNKVKPDRLYQSIFDGNGKRRKRKVKPVITPKYVEEERQRILDLANK